MKTCAFLVLFFFSICLSAQDNIFSFYGSTPLHLNPSLAGMGDNAELILNARSQWQRLLDFNGYYDMSVNYNLPVKFKGNKFGFGLQSNFSQAGQVKFRTIEFLLSLSYHMQLVDNTKRSSFISLGIQSGIARNSISVGDLRWGTQHNGNGGFDPALPGEDIKSSRVYGEIGMGLSLNDFTSNGDSKTIGFSMYHISEPNISFYDTSVVNLDRRYNFHGQYSKSLSEHLNLIPGFLIAIQSQQHYYDIGIGFDIGLAKNVSQKIGIRPSIRAGRSVNSNFDVNGLNFQTTFRSARYFIGLSTEFELNSGLSSTSIFRGFELIFAYTFVEN